MIYTFKPVNYLGKAFSIASFLLVFIAGTVPAQEGYPLEGTWRGEWGGSEGDKSRVVIVLKWDGRNINGLINPGRKQVRLASAELYPETWTVRFAAEDADGTSIRVEGRLDNIGSYNRTIAGTWTRDGIEYPFTITRD